MKLIATSGAIILAMLTTSAFAQANDDGPRTLFIRTADLDLTSRKDVRTVRHRISIAIVDLCGSASATDLEGALKVTKCRHDLTARGRVDLSRTIATAQNKVRPAIQTAEAGSAPPAIMPPSSAQR